ncbi:APC family permease [Saccharopolyspora karakumensis]|nr:APC family permease [Saccharopolyspora karakumensis]
MSDVETRENMEPSGRPSRSVDEPGAVSGLRGRMGTAELVLAVLAFAAPLATVSGVFPIVIMYGGAGAPVSYAVATTMLLLFAIALGAMARKVPNAGGFYAYITAGLGRRLGLGGGMLAIFSYWLIAVACYVFLGSAISRMVVELGGPEVPWYVCQWVALVIIGVFGYLNIELSAKVLSTVMVLEVLIVVVFDLVVGASGGAEGFSLAPLGVNAFLSGNVGVGVLFAAFCFLGFESTAIYREEARNPEKTIPRAMWVSVLSIGIFYVVSALMLVLAFGQEKAVSIANEDPSAMFTAAVASNLGPVAVDIVGILLATSVFASMLAVQNMLSRYLYSFGQDGVLPKRLGSTHPRHRSPAVASVIVTVAILIGSVPFAFAEGDEMMVYAHISGVGIYAITVLMLMASIAVVAYFRRQGAQGMSVWQTAVIPVIATLGLGAVVVLATLNFEHMTELTGVLSILLVLLTFAVVVAGVLLATVLRSQRPQAYQRIGRQQG